MSQTPRKVLDDPADPGILERFLADATVDDYAQTRSRDAVTDVGARRPGAWFGLVVAGIVGLVIAGALLNTRLSTEERQETRTALGDRVASLSALVDERRSAVDVQASTVKELQDRLLAGSEAGPARAEAIGQLAGAAAATELAGGGVTVTLDDAPDAAAGSLNRVLDRDLQDVVNALWREGVEGIAINGQRLTATTAIRAAGEAILVNYQPLNRPYVVSAVGPASAADDDSGLSRLLSALSNDYGLVTGVRAGDVALPAGELRSPRFATTTGQGGGVAGP